MRQTILNAPILSPVKYTILWREVAKYTESWMFESPYTSRQVPGTWGMLDMRWSGKAVTTMFDGSTKMQNLDDLRDMTKWSNYATSANWTFQPGP